MVPSYEQELRKVLEAVQKSADRHGEDATEELETDQEKEQLVAAPSPPIVSKVTAKTLFSHPDAHPIVLDLALLQKYGAEWLSWEPETVRFRAEQELGQVSDLNFAKMMACKTLHLVDSFWTSWEVFGWCAMAFNNVFPDFSILQVPSAADAAVAVDISKRIREDVPWSNEVTKYLEVVCAHDHVFVPIPPLDFLHVDASHTRIDVEDVKARWPEVRTSGTVPAGDTVTDEQLRRMLDIQQQLSVVRSRLRTQVALVA